MLIFYQWNGHTVTLPYLHKVRHQRHEGDVEESPRREGKDVHEGRLQIAARLEHQGYQSTEETNKRSAHLSFGCFPPEKIIVFLYFNAILELYI